MIGKVMEVFIPNDDLNMIGFKVSLGDDILEIVQVQNRCNSNIYRDDTVFVSYKDELLEIEKVENEE